MYLDSYVIHSNLAKALPWFSDVREKLLDPNYNQYWFLKFKNGINGSYSVPPCTSYKNSSYHDNKCSEFYHDEWHRTPDQTQCKNECDCGKGLPCGEYIWDHRNTTLQKWLTDVFIMGPSENNGENSMGLNNPNIDGFYIDDHWTNISKKSEKNPACDMDPFGGVSEERPNCTMDMGLNTQEKVTELYTAWRQSMDLAQQTIVENNGFEWHLFDFGVKSPSQSACTNWFKGEGAGLNKVALQFSFAADSPTDAEFMIDLATFLLVRGDYAWLGYFWNGCHSDWVYGDWNEMLDKDYGKPTEAMKEVSNGVFQRKWSKAMIEMNCNTYKPTITFDT